eukprot:INCI19663.1.p1 GENE.INCI19663.1~~INCI19663.1.p1  ORF type:complete len:329 (-),score=51.20 INCI19663.1:843-1829(-)
MLSRLSATLCRQRVGSVWSGLRCATTSAAAATDEFSTEPVGSKPTANFYALSATDFEEVLTTSFGQPRFRAKQIQDWVYKKGVEDFRDMKNLPKALRGALAEHFSFGTLSVVSEEVSRDGTIKRAYELEDGQLIESVLMPYDDGRQTACISSQAGCSMGCVFCATGQMGFSRQLSADEIFEQASRFNAELLRRERATAALEAAEAVSSSPNDDSETPLKVSHNRHERLSNVVFMGMGEPLANFKNVMEAVRRMNNELGIGARHITISTVGLAPRIRRLAEEGLQVSLAVSLHQANDKARSALMPVNKRFPIHEVLDACRFYIEQTKYV